MRYQEADKGDGAGNGDTRADPEEDDDVHHAAQLAHGKAERLRRVVGKAEQVQLRHQPEQRQNGQHHPRPELVQLRPGEIAQTARQPAHDAARLRLIQQERGAAEGDAKRADGNPGENQAVLLQPAAAVADIHHQRPRQRPADSGRGRKTGAAQKMLHRRGRNPIRRRTLHENEDSGKTSERTQRGNGERDRTALMRAPTAPGEKNAEQQDERGKRQRRAIDQRRRHIQRKIARRRRRQKYPGENNAEAGARVNGQKRRRGKRIARHRLQEQPADRQHRADQNRGNQARQPHLQHHALIQRQTGSRRMREHGKHLANTRPLRQKEPGRIQRQRHQGDQRQQPTQPRGQKFHTNRTLWE